MDFSFGSVVKNLPSNAGDTGSIPDRGRSLKKKRKKERKKIEYTCNLYNITH